LCNLRCKSDLISIISRVSVTAWQRASGICRRRWRLWLAYPIMTSLRCVRNFGNSEIRSLRLARNPAYLFASFKFWPFSGLFYVHNLPAGELTALPWPPNWWGGSLLLPKNPSPTIGLRRRFLDRLASATDASLRQKFRPSKWMCIDVAAIRLSVERQIVSQTNSLFDLPSRI